MFPSDQYSLDREEGSLLGEEGGRRAFLAGLVATVATFAVTAPSAEAAVFGKKGQAPKLPKSWINHLGKDAIEYGRFINSLNLRCITAQQVIAPHLKTHGRVRNVLPPRRLWKKMKKTIIIADAVCFRLKTRPTEIVSAYRSPAYNRTCRGANRKSYHMQNLAVDIKLPVSAWRVARKAREMRNQGIFKGGIGKYRTFTHIDTRGYNADW